MGDRTWIIGLKIDGLGDGEQERTAALTDGRFRLASRVPTWDSAGVYRSVLQQFPRTIGTSVDWQAGTLSIGGISLDLRRTAETEQWFMQGHFDGAGILTTALTDAIGTSVILDTAGLGQTSIMIGREAIALGTEAGAGPYTYSPCTRGALNTIAAAHPIGATDDYEAFAVGSHPVLEDRPVEVFRVRLRGETYTNEEVLWRGIIRDINFATGSWTITLGCDSVVEVLRRQQILRGLWRSDGDSHSGARLAWSGVGTIVRDSAVKTALVSLGGETVVKVATEVSAGRTAFGRQVVWEGFAGAETPPGAPAPNTAWQVFSTFYNAPGINDSADTLSSNVLTLTLQILTSTDTRAKNGSYDHGVSILGCGIPAGLIDITGIETLRDTLGDDRLRMRRIFLGMDGMPVSALEFIQRRLLHPFGLSLVWGSGGLLTIKGFADGSVTVAAAITDADFVTLPTWRRHGTRGFDALTVLWGEVPGVGPNSDEYSDSFLHQRHLAGFGITDTIEAHGIETEDAALLIGVDFTSRFHHPIPEISATLRSSVEVWPGDVVTVTHGLLPGRTGTPGWTTETCLVSSRELDLENGELRVTLLWVGALYNRPGRIGASARVVSYAAPVVTCEANAFTPTTGAPHANDVAAFTALSPAPLTPVGIDLLDADLSFRASGTVTATSGNTMTLSIGTAPQADDVIVLRDYDNATPTTLQDTYAYLADASDTLGAAGDAPYEWST